MTYPKQLFQWLILLPILGFGLAACFEEDSGGGGSVFHCSYEVSSTGCNNSIYSAYKSGCLTVNSADLRSDVNVAKYCANVYPSSDISCAATCCVSFKYRNVTQSDGACPGGTGNLAALQTVSASSSSNGLKFEVSWSSGDVDLEVLTPMRELVSSQSPQIEGCTYSGDDRYVLNGPVESVQCQGLYLSGAYEVILNNHSTDAVAVNLTITKNGELFRQEQLSVTAGEPLVHPVSVQ